MARRDWVITIIGLVVIALVLQFLYQKEQARQHQFTMWQHRCDLIREVDPLNERLTTGKKALADKNYADAKKILEQTKSDARQVLMRLETEISDCKNETERSLFAPMKKQADAVQKEADDLLLSEEVRYGGEGLVQFEGKWMTPGRAKEIEETRFAEAQRAKGLVLFDGKWMTSDERALLKEKKFAEEQKAKGLVLFRGEWVTPEKRQELLGELWKRARAAITPRPAAPAAGAAPAAAVPSGAFAAQNAVWVLDDFESGAVAWQVEQWSDPSQVEIGALEGSKAMGINYAGGQQQKSALARGFGRMDLSTRAKLLMDVQNNGKRSVKISIMFNADQAYETRERSVGPGVHKDVSFDVKGAAFKCASDGWQSYRFPIGKPDAVNRVTLMINTPAQIIVDNIRLSAQ